LSLEKIPLELNSNNSGGTLGGITTGEDVYFKVAIKPVSTISKEQITHDFDGNEKYLKATGRHDPCVLPRAMPIIESMAALVVMDFVLIQASKLNLQEDVNEIEI
jgi:chorismate synthase